MKTMLTFDGQETEVSESTYNFVLRPHTRFRGFATILHKTKSRCGKCKQTRFRRATTKNLKRVRQKMPSTQDESGEIVTEEGFAEDATTSSDAATSEDEGFPTCKNVKKPQETMATIESIANKEVHEKFFKEAIDILLKEAVFKGCSRENKVVEWRNPEELRAAMDIDVTREGCTHEEMLRHLRDVIKYSVKTAHPYFVNQLFSAVDPYGLIGQWLTDALNPSVYTYEVSPVFTLMEEAVLKEMRTIVGFPEGKGDGIFCPGGSIANGYGISCARYKFIPNIKESGLHGLPRLVLFTSRDAHYSVKKLASYMGLGMSNVYAVGTDERGRMDIADLRVQVARALAEDAAPFMVSATAGTTVLGAFDPLDELADVCAEFGMWLHVDAAWGGGALMSKKRRGLLKGIHRADSITWNPHKLLTAPQQCSTFLLKHENILSEVHSTNATYLFQKDKFYDTKYDTGDKHIQCGRRADVLKFWYMWKAKGSDGFEKHIDKVFDNAKYFTELIRNREGYKIVLPEPECTNVCFWYIPPSLRGQENQPDFNEKLHKVAPKIKERMIKEGTMMITYQPLRKLPNFFRIVMQSSSLTHEDMNYFIKEIERLGANL